MNKKLILTLAGIALLIVVVIVVVIIKNNVVTPENSDAAEFELVCSERLAGFPATEYSSDDSTVEVKFSDKGYIRKAYAGADNSDISDEYPQSTEQEIDRMKVNFKGKDGKVWLAFWSYKTAFRILSVSVPIPKA